MATPRNYRSAVLEDRNPADPYLIALNVGGNLRKIQNVVLLKKISNGPGTADDRWLVRVAPTELVDSDLLAPEISGVLVVYDKEILGPTVESPITRAALAAAARAGKQS